MNFPLVTALSAIIITQLIKYPIAKFSKKPTVDLDIVTSTGGMPSSHSAATSSLITSLIIQYGFSSPYVAIATIFGVIVMFDSMGVRRQSGEQGLVLDRLIQDYHKRHPQVDLSGSRELEDMIIKKYLGHKPSEVIVGVFTGIVLAIVMYRFYGLALQLQ
ncbi:TPA: divergent PAP2 family protein [Streptococcus suis]